MPDLLPEGDLEAARSSGINPGLWTAAVQTHFAQPGNRFYPALLRAGILTEPVSSFGGDDRRATATSSSPVGSGITNLVPRATAGAAELTPAELREGGERLRALVADAPAAGRGGPGITAYRQAFGRPRSQASGRRTSRSRAPSCGWCRTPAD